MKLIAAVDENWGIGLGDALLFRISEDLARFRALTMGNVVVMGRRTLLTLPGGRPLKHRQNIVLSRDAGLRIPGAAVVNGTQALFNTLLAAPYVGREVYCIGGEEVYRLLMPYCEAALITHVRRTARADKFLAPLDSLPGWRLGESGPLMGDPPHAYFTYYNDNVVNYLSQP